MLAAGEPWSAVARATALALRRVAAGWAPRGKMCDGGGSRNKPVARATALHQSAARWASTGGALERLAQSFASQKPRGLSSSGAKKAGDLEGKSALRVGVLA